MMLPVQERLRECREAAGMTQADVAEFEGISEQYVSQLERGTNKPRGWPLLAKLARRYSTSTDYLLGLTDDPAPKGGADLPALIRYLAEMARDLSPMRLEELVAIVRVMLRSEREMLWRYAQLQSRLAEIANLDPETLELVIATLLQRDESRGGFRQTVKTLLAATAKDGDDSV